MSITTLEPKSRKGIGGPKTAEGKKRVSLNAMKHGLDSRSPQAKATIEELVGVSYEEILTEMRGHYQPVDAIEEILVERVARCAWRIAYLQAIENKYLERRTHLSIGKGYEKIMKNERLIDIQLHRAIAALSRKQELRDKKASQSTPSPAPCPTNNLECQNKLNNTPTPSSTHAQNKGEFVPNSNANKSRPFPTKDCRLSTVDSLHGKGEFVPHSIANKSRPFPTKDCRLSTVDSLHGTCGSCGGPTRPRVRLGIRYPLSIKVLKSINS